MDVPGPAEQLGVPAERARVAADEHEHGSVESDEGGSPRCPEAAARRVGDHDLGAEIRRGPPTADLAADDLVATSAEVLLGVGNR